MQNFFGTTTKNKDMENFFGTTSKNTNKSEMDNFFGNTSTRKRNRKPYGQRKLNFQSTVDYRVKKKFLP